MAEKCELECWYLYPHRLTNREGYRCHAGDGCPAWCVNCLNAKECPEYKARGWCVKFQVASPQRKQEIWCKSMDQYFKAITEAVRSYPKQSLQTSLEEKTNCMIISTPDREIKIGMNHVRAFVDKYKIGGYIKRFNEALLSKKE